MKAAIIAAATALIGGTAAAGDLSITIGQDFSEGDFGTSSETNAGVTLLSARLRVGDWSFSASSGYVDLGEEEDFALSGPLGRDFVLIPGGPVNGYTDVVFGAYGTLRDETETLPGVALSASIKLPTADTSEGIGTGSTDFFASSELFKTYGSYTAYVFAGGRFRGEAEPVEPDDFTLRLGPVDIDVGDLCTGSAIPGVPDGVDLDALRTFLCAGEALQTRDSFEGGFGVQRPFGDDIVAGLGYDYRGASFEGAEDAHELSALISYSPIRSTTISAYVYRGFTDASPSIGAGVLVSYKFLRWR